MTASRPDIYIRSAALLAACLALMACRSPAAPPFLAIERADPRFGARVPDAADHTAAELAAAALASDTAATERAMRRLVAIDNVLSVSEGQATGLGPVSEDLINATLNDPRYYRRATRKLLERDDLDASTRTRLNEAERDDPLALARARIRDARVKFYGRAFNVVAEPLGRSILTSSAAPYRLAAALIQYAAELYTAEALTLQERQALDHWKQYTARHPESPEARKIEPRVQATQARLNELHRDRLVRSAQRSLGRGGYRLALVYANRALDYAPEDSKASQIRDRAARKLSAQRETLRRTLDAGEPEGIAEIEQARVLTVALLDPEGDVEAAAQALLTGDPQGPLADEARFALVLAREEDSGEDAMWRAMSELADGDVEDSNMARHAAALVNSPEQNPHRAYHAAKSRDRWRNARFVMLGSWYRGGPDRGIPRPIEWVIGAPSVMRTLMGMPVRLIQLPWKSPSTGRTVRVYAKQYLQRYPDGAHEEEMRDWLEAFDERHDNYIGALAIAEGRDDLSPTRRKELREKAAQQALDMAAGEKRRDLRNTMLKYVAREFSDTVAGIAAGHRARDEVEQASEQRIRVTRGFLLDNPEVAGPRGFALTPGLLDENLSNGELHPEGIVFLGMNLVEINLVDEGSDEKDPPKRVKRKLSPDRMARLVSQLEETAIENALADVDDFQAADAQRDVYFERVRLGLADDVDPRAGSTSQYVYRGLRERYGLVRRREPILPFDLVIKGNFTDLSIGAFPRIREPRKTPDAFLYK